MRVTIPKEVQAELASLPPLSGLLWQKEECLTILIKLPEEIDFLSSRLGHRAISHPSSAAGQGEQELE